MKKIVVLLVLLLTVIAALGQAIPEEGPSVSAPQAASLSSNASNDTQIYTKVEVMAKLPVSLNEFLSKNLKYPIQAVDNDVSGSIFIQFVVEKDGSISNIRTKGARKGYGLEEEAIRVIKLLPKIEPAHQNGKNVRSYFTIPIRFQLQ